MSEVLKHKSDDGSPRLEKVSELYYDTAVNFENALRTHREAGWRLRVMAPIPGKESPGRPEDAGHMFPVYCCVFERTYPSA